MQPINEKLDALSWVGEGKGMVDVSLAEYYARRWIRLNTVRIVMPMVAGGMALWQSMGL